MYYVLSELAQISMANDDEDDPVIVEPITVAVELAVQWSRPRMSLNARGLPVPSPLSESTNSKDICMYKWQFLCYGKSHSGS